MSVVYDTDVVLIRVNNESENIGIMREVMGQDRWFFDCESCNMGSGGFDYLSDLVRAINLHKTRLHSPYALDTRGIYWNSSNNRSRRNTSVSNRKVGG